MTECGYTPTEVREVSLLDYQSLVNHWRWQPPLRVLVAMCAVALGIKLPEKPDPKNHMTTEEALRMFAQTGGKIEGVGQF